MTQKFPILVLLLMLACKATIKTTPENKEVTPPVDGTSVLNILSYPSTDFGFYLRFDDTASLNDSTPHRNDAVLMDGAQVVSNNLSLDGTDDYVQLPDVPEIHLTNVKNISVGGWVKLAAAPTTSPCGSAMIFLYDDRDEGDGDGPNPRSLIQFSIFNTREVNLVFGTNPGSLTTSKTTDTVTLNQWTHLMFVMDKTNSFVHTYINGVLSKSTAIPSIAAFETTGQYPQIGRFAQGACRSFFNGEIDEFFWINQALTATEIQNIYTAQQSLFP